MTLEMDGLELLSFACPIGKHSRSKVKSLAHEAKLEITVLSMEQAESSSKSPTSTVILVDTLQAQSMVQSILRS